jgi:hypothetical protein
MQWIISMEQPDGSWEPTGEVFEGSMDDVNAHLSMLHQSTGVCHSATLKQ